MAKFKVIALSVGALNNQIFESGDIVDGENFPEDNIQALIDQKFIEPFNQEHKAEVEFSEESLLKLSLIRLKEIVTENEWVGDNFAKLKSKTEIVAFILAKLQANSEDVIPTIDEVGTGFLIEELKKAEVEFSEEGSKEDLYTLWVLSLEYKA